LIGSFSISQEAPFTILFFNTLLPFTAGPATQIDSFLLPHPECRLCKVLVTDRDTQQMLNKCLLIDSSRAPMPACSPCASAWGRLASVFLGSIFFLSSEGNLEPQIKDLINRINELQQGKLGDPYGQAGDSKKGLDFEHLHFLIYKIPVPYPHPRTG
jgi:hypothetical protein